MMTAMMAVAAARGSWRRRILCRWLVVAVLALPAVAPAQEPKGKSAEDIVKGLLGGAGEPAFETRGIGGVRPEPRVAPRAVARPPAPAPSGGRIALPIQFKLDSAEITTQSLEQMRSLAEALSDPRLEAARILVEGHTDNQGSEAHNQWLSERRAEAVRRFLVEKGNVSAARLESRGYGKSRPLADVSQDTEEGRARNRRVEFVNLGSGAEPARLREPRPDPAVASELKVGVSVTYERAGQTRTLWPGGVLMRSDNYRVTFTPSENGYVYVYQIDATGRAEPLFPNSKLSPAGNPVTARQAYTVPAAGQWLGLEGTPGDEEIVVVAARNELPDALAVARRREGQARPLPTRGPAAGARADVTVEGVFSYRLSFEHR